MFGPAATLTSTITVPGASATPPSLSSHNRRHPGGIAHRSPASPRGTGSGRQPPRMLDDLLRRQAGLVAVRQAQAHGVSPRTLQRRAAEAGWERLHPAPRRPRRGRGGRLGPARRRPAVRHRPSKGQRTRRPGLDPAPLHLARPGGRPGTRPVRDPSRGGPRRGVSAQRRDQAERGSAGSGAAGSGAAGSSSPAAQRAA